MRSWIYILGAALAVAGIACGSDDATPTAPSNGTPPSSQSPPTPAPGTPSPAPGVTITALDVNPSVLTGGQNAQGLVTLSSAAPAEGTVVGLSSTNTSAATVPSNVTVAAGASTATFPVQTREVTAETALDIAGTAGGETRAKTIRLLAPSGALSALAPESDVIGAGQTSPITVRLSGQASSNGLSVALSASDSIVSTPPLIVIPSGATSGTFSVTARPTTSETSVTVTASAGGQSRTAQLRVWPVFIQTFSTPGDLVGLGRSVRVDAGPSAIFNGQAWDGNNRIDVYANNPSDASKWWSVTMAAPPGRALTPGVYRNARRQPAIGSGLPRLIVSGDMRGCNQSNGEFEVLEAAYGPVFQGAGFSGSVARFRATFKQSCEESPSDQLTGEVRFATILLGCKYTNNC